MTSMQHLGRSFTLSPRPAWLTESWRLWVLAGAAYTGLYGLWLALRPESDLLHLVVGHLAQLPPGLLAARFALALRHEGALPPALRRVWMFLGMALLMWLGGGLIWSLYRLFVGQRPPLPSLADPVYMAGHLLALAALLSFPLLPRGRFGRFRMLLDLAILSGVSFAFGWLFLLQPIFLRFAVELGESLWLAVYVALDVALLLMLVNLTVLLEPGPARRAFWLIGAALLAIALADLAYTYLGLRGRFDNDVLFDLARIIGFSLIGISALRQRLRSPAARSDPPLLSRWRRRLQALFPLAAGIAFGWLTVVDWQTSGQLNTIAAWVTVALSIALVARQGVVAGEVELSQYAQLVDSAADPAFICDARGNLQLANPALAAAIGLSHADDLLRRSLFSLITPATLPAELSLPPRRLSPLVLESGWSGEVSLRRADDSEFPVYLSLRPVPHDSGAPTVLAGTAHDLSVQKRQQNALIEAYEAAAAARQALEELNAQLEVKVEAKTRDLQQAYTQLTRQNEELKTLDRLKSDFVSMVSHELRAPLTNIAGGMELVLALSTDLGPRTRERLVLVQSEIQRLSRFVETILDISALEAGRLPLTLAPLKLETALEPLRVQWAASPAGHRLRVDLPPTLPPVLADARALTSVLFHLVDNALKYAPEGEVSVSAVATPFGVRVSVSDHGPGIPPELRELIFEKFQRLNAADAQTVYGHGLGLYMVRRLLTAMQTDIELDDTPGGGARFTFELPIVADEA